jgi:Tfp pilus assembly protein PilF
MFLFAEAFRDAMGEFRASLSLNVEDRKTWAGLVEAARGVDRAELQSFIEDTLRKHPLDAVRLSAADFYTREGNHVRAFELLQAVLDRDPANIEALQMAVDLLADPRNPLLAQLSDRLLSADPENPAALHHLASIRMSQGRVDEAIQLAKRSLERDVRRSQARGLLAVAYERTFQPDLAEAEFRRSIELAPEDWVPYNNYGIFLLGRNRIPEAQEQFRRGISLNPENVQGFVGIGEAFRQAGRRQDADRWYRKALKMDPANPVAKQYAGR